MFYLYICANFVNRFLTLIKNGIFGSSHSRVLFKIVILYILGEFLLGVHFQWSCRSAVLVGVGFFVGVSQLFLLLIV